MGIFSKNLKSLRKQRGLNQNEISLLFKKKGNTVGNWENSKSEPSIGELVKLAEYFKVSLNELLHTDLQKETLNAMDSAASGTSAPNIYPVDDAITSFANDGNGDSFWLILRELRSLNEKIDDLKRIQESVLQKPGSDKSNH